MSASKYASTCSTASGTGHLNVLGRVELAIPTGISVRKGACLSIISNLNT